MTSTALIVTYTMSHPHVVGVFLRALRLARALHARGFRTYVLNEGPCPDDPKLDALPPSVELRAARPRPDCHDAGEIQAWLTSFAPDVVVFGEGPIELTRLIYHAARRLPAPFVLLDQFYQRWLHRPAPDVDLTLLYGLRPFWSAAELGFDRRTRLVPPFIGEVAAPDALPLARDERPRVTILGFDPGVLQGGIALAAELREVHVVTLSHDPARAATALRDAGLAGASALPLQDDSTLFGLIASSRAVLLANGCMQIMEALALACPAVCLERGVGLPAWALDARFKPYVSIGESPALQRARLRAFLAAPPFPAPLARELASERDGAQTVAAHVERLARQACVSPGAWLRRRRRRGTHETRRSA